MTLNPTFNAALATFVATWNAKLAATGHDGTLTVDPYGRKYLRIVHNRVGGGRSSYGFVRIADGAILMSASWKSPAKGVRGSIYVNAGMDAVGPYGVKYLSGPNIGWPGTGLFDGGKTALAAKYGTGVVTLDLSK